MTPHHSICQDCLNLVGCSAIELPQEIIMELMVYYRILRHDKLLLRYKMESLLSKHPVPFEQAYEHISHYYEKCEIGNL